MQTVLLCGGRGTRVYPATATVPKPLLEVDGVPILRHVMDIYASQGFTDFILSAGWLAASIGTFAQTLPAEWAVDVVDTGVDTNTAGRIAKVAHLIDGPFFANYGDGVADVDLHDLREFHRSHAGTATLTTAALPSPYGIVEQHEDGRVTAFAEKPSLSEHRINGGWFVFEPSALEHFVGEDLEREVLPALAERGDLFAYRHDGFWRSLDTHKDQLALDELAQGGRPWLRT